MNTKKLFTLNRQLFDKETKVKIGDIESFCPSYDIEDIQKKIAEIRYQHHIDNRDKPAIQRHYSEISSKGKETWSKDYIYSFTVYGKNHGACYWIEYHELPISTAVMYDIDLM